ncbi:MAG: glycosyltransferase [Chloroflexi bacterium]|uniref:glycosyltransferase n=1 Tax=Candidatus Flexifilum breve TaxID=3140694 RepID=UPI003135860D|nr:glycosyltransferase [Chloroflexota bacterium]
MSAPIRRVSMISFHTCPLAQQEGKETGGMNVYVYELSRQLSRQGIAVDVFTRSQDSHQPHIVQVDPFFRVIHVPAGPESPVPKKQLIQYLPEFVANYHKFVAEQGVQYDVMHCHYYLSGLIGIEIQKTTPLPLIMTFHTLALMKNLVARDELELEERPRIDAEFELVRVADAIIAPSESDQRYLQYLLEADLNRVVVIPPGVDLENFKPIDQREARAHLGMDPDELLILFCGRIEPLKGIDMLLYATKIMIEQNPDMRVGLTIIGGNVSQPPSQWSKELQKLEELRHLLRLAPLVRFAGQQPQEILPYYYNAADVAVMPSHYESFGMAAAEAMACGTPIITTNATGISTLIDGRHDLLITSVNNPLLLASQMGRLLMDRAQHDQISQQMLNTVQDLNWTTVAERVVDVYAATLQHVQH